MAILISAATAAVALAGAASIAIDDETLSASARMGQPRRIAISVVLPSRHDVAASIPAHSVAAIIPPGRGVVVALGLPRVAATMPVAATVVASLREAA